MPPAARISDMHTCPTVNPGPVPLVGHPCVCMGPLDTIIAKGSSTVMIGNMPAVRIGDTTVHGGVIVAGCPTVMIWG